MFNKDLLQNLKLLFNAKFEIKPPPCRDIVIYDHGVDQLEFLKKNECYVLHTRGEKINLFILIKTILKMGFYNLKNNYRIIFIEHIKPKFIITYRCDNKLFYELKNQIKGIKTILIQWGKTIEEYFIHFKEKQNYFFVDQMYLYGDETAKIFSKFIKGNTFSIGSIANNRFKFGDEVEKDSLIFISQAKSKRIFPEIEKIILKFLKSYCLKNNLKLYVSTRVLYNDEKGKKNYENILGETGWNYMPRKILDAPGDYEAYKRVMLSEYVVFIDSTLGYEALSRKKKLVAFPFGCTSPEWCKKNYKTGFEKDNFYVPSKFGYPLNLENEGEFWLSEYNLEKMNNKLNFILNIDKDSWEKILKKIGSEKVIKFDLYNDTLIKNLKTLGVPLKKDNLSK